MHFIPLRMENAVIDACRDVIYGEAKEANLTYKITNCERTFGATLSYHIAKKYQDAGLPKGKSININLAGSAGQSFGAFLISGVIMTLEGDANDYLGKGLSGGTLVVFPPKDSSFASEENVIAGKSIKVVASMKMQGFPFPVKMIGG